MFEFPSTPYPQCRFHTISRWGKVSEFSFYETEKIVSVGLAGSIDTYNFHTIHFGGKLETKKYGWCVVDYNNQTYDFDTNKNRIVHILSQPIQSQIVFLKDLRMNKPTLNVQERYTGTLRNAIAYNNGYETLGPLELAPCVNNSSDNLYPSQQQIIHIFQLFPWDENFNIKMKDLI